MVGTRQLQRLNRLKHKREETTTGVSAAGKRLRKSTATEATATMPNLQIPKDALKVYQQLLPGNTDGIAFLFGTTFSDALQAAADGASNHYGITQEDAIEELRRFIAIKAFTVDSEACKISPTPLMDQLWHSVILDTQVYAGLQDALGIVLHHRPSGASAQEYEQREKRLAAMKSLYTVFFSNDPLESTPSVPVAAKYPVRPRNHIRIFVQKLDGEALSLLVDKAITADGLKLVIQDKEGIPPLDQRLIFAGDQLENGTTLTDYKIKNGSVLHLVNRLRAC